MLAIQYLILFAMVYLILFYFLNFEKRNEVKWFNIGVFAVLVVIDVIRQVHYGYQPIRDYDPVIGLSAVFAVGQYALNGFKLWRTWLVLALSIFVSLFVTAVATVFVFGVLEVSVLVIHTEAMFNVLGAFSGLILLGAFYLMVKILKLKINVSSISKGEFALIVFFIAVFGFFITSFYVLADMREGWLWGMVMNFLALLSGVLGIYFILYLATQRSIIHEIKNREKQQVNFL